MGFGLDARDVGPEPHAGRPPGWCGPCQSIFGLGRNPPLSAFMHPRLLEPVAYKWVHQERLEHIRLLVESLNEMHRECTDTSDAKRAAARGQRTGKREVKQIHFSIGDFVLVGSVMQHPQNLSVRWKGPYLVTNVVSDFVMDVEGLLPPIQSRAIMPAASKCTMKAAVK